MNAHHEHEFEAAPGLPEPLELGEGIPERIVESFSAALAASASAALVACSSGVNYMGVM